MGKGAVVAEAEADEIALNIEDVDLTKIKSMAALREFGEELQQEIRELGADLGDADDQLEELTDAIDSRDATLSAYQSVTRDWQQTAQEAQRVAERSNTAALAALALRDEAVDQLRGARSYFVGVMRTMRAQLAKAYGDAALAKLTEIAAGNFAKEAERCNHGLAAKVVQLESTVQQITALYDSASCRASMNLDAFLSASRECTSERTRANSNHTAFMGHSRTIQQLVTIGLPVAAVLGALAQYLVSLAIQ